MRALTISFGYEFSAVNGQCHWVFQHVQMLKTNVLQVLGNMVRVFGYYMEALG